MPDRYVLRQTGASTAFGFIPETTGSVVIGQGSTAVVLIAVLAGDVGLVTARRAGTGLIRGCCETGAARPDGGRLNVMREP